MFSLVKNYKKLFLTFIKNNAFETASAWEISSKITELKDLGKDGIDENEEKSVKDTLQEISKYLKNNNEQKVTKEQLKEIIDFLENQRQNALKKEQKNIFSGNVKEDNDFWDFDDYKISNFLWEKKSEFEALKEKYFGDKNEIVNDTMDSTKQIEKDFLGNEIVWKYTNKNWEEENVLLKNISSPGANGVWEKIRYEVELDNSAFIDKSKIFNHKPSEIEIKNAKTELLEKYNKENGIKTEVKTEIKPMEEVKVEIEANTYWFIIEKDWTIIMPEWVEMTDDNTFKNTETEEEYKLENWKIVKLSWEKVETETSKNSNSKNFQKINESKEKNNSSLEDVRKFYTKVWALEWNINSIQRELIDRWFLESDVNWKIDEKTFKAIKKFQKENWLKLIDWKIWNNTLKKLFYPYTTVDNFYWENVENLEKKLGDNMYWKEARDWKIDLKDYITKSNSGNLEKKVVETKENNIQKITESYWISEKELWDFKNNFLENYKDWGAIENYLENYSKQKLTKDQKESVKNFILNTNSKWIKDNNISILIKALQNIKEGININLEKKENNNIDIIIKHFGITKSEFNDFKWNFHEKHQWLLENILIHAKNKNKEDIKNIILNIKNIKWFDDNKSFSNITILTTEINKISDKKTKKSRGGEIS